MCAVNGGSLIISHPGWKKRTSSTSRGLDNQFTTSFLAQRRVLSVSKQINNLINVAADEGENIENTSCFGSESRCLVACYGSYMYNK
ncbi:hypothetical protein AVEN_203179-1 [Araneus ventricosus]|uniref:Uncharacterized protein n=1 Tax=Araneus ventricosus TaxID=182803 RepID=A0A4Y2CIM7_ARAVE|nr:hypothetical protein AVEN_203179-1 [Araneus ventricosus]